MSKWLIAVTTGLVLSGCTKPIEQPVASRQLVENVVERDKNLIPEQYWGELDSAERFSNLSISKYNITLLDLYDSASGKVCRRFEATEVGSDSSAEIRVACRKPSETAWYLSAPTVSNLTYDLRLGN